MTKQYDSEEFFVKFCRWMEKDYKIKIAHIDSMASANDMGSADVFYQFLLGMFAEYLKGANVFDFANFKLVIVPQ